MSDKPYKIKDLQYKKALRLNLNIYPSKKKYKKIDVFDKDMKFLASIGDKRYSDFATYIQTDGQEYAENRRRLYRIRHEKTRHKEGTPSYYSDQILW